MLLVCAGCSGTTQDTTESSQSSVSSSDAEEASSASASSAQTDPIDTADTDVYFSSDTESSSAETPTAASSTDAQTETPSVSADQLIIMQDPSMYTYADMVSDTAIINALYSGYVTQDVIGYTADGRELIHFVVGNPNAGTQIFINGAIHAREYLTAQLVMKQMVTYIQHVVNGDSYGDISYQTMWENCAIHVVPMVNPDGVSISQLGLEGINNASVLEGVYNIAAADGVEITDYYLDTWKANAVGVDLNRNFDAYWEEYSDPVGHVSSDHYKGTSPGSEAESAALISLTQSCNFSYTISYHTQGQVIYWCFDNMDAIYDKASAWASQLSAATGYYLDSNYEVIVPAGYSDWTIYRCQIPSVTIEVASGESPYLSDQFAQVFAENSTVWELTVAAAISG